MDIIVLFLLKTLRWNLLLKPEKVPQKNVSME